MNSRILQLILGVIFFLSSTPGGMAENLIPGKARADFFVATEQVSVNCQALEAEEELSQGAKDSRASQAAAFAPQGEASMAEGENEVSSNNGSARGKQSKRFQKRQQQKQNPVCSARLIVKNRLSASSGSEGYEGAPLKQDALQQRTSMIRFLHLAAGID